MVLHNSKWDKKATRNYNRKHGLTKPTEGPGGSKKKYPPHRDQPLNQYAEESSGEDDSQEDGSGGSEEDSEGEEENPENLSALIPDAPGPPPPSGGRSGRRGDIKKLPSNNWRYTDPVSDDEALFQAMTQKQNEMDEEQKMILAEEVNRRKTQKEVEEEELRLARSLRRDPKEINLEAAAALDAAQKKKSKHKKNGEDDDEYYQGDYNEMDEEDDLEALIMASESKSDPSTVKPKKGQVQQFEDKTEFYALQQEIEKARAAKEIKHRFGTKKSKSSKEVVMEENIDDFLSSIDNLKVSADATKEKKGPSLFSGSANKPIGHKSLENSEAWLDNLLN